MYNKYRVNKMKYEITSHNTKKLLAASLKKALLNHPLSKVTVSGIVKDCGINRNTFYYHFKDIYDLMKWTFEDEAIEVVKKIDLISDYDDAIRFVMNYVEENEHILNCAYDSIGREGMKQFLHADFISVIESIIDYVEKKSERKLEEDYKGFVANFYTEAIAGMVIDWLKNRETRDKEKTVRYISDTIRYSLAGIFKYEDNTDKKILQHS